MTAYQALFQPYPAEVPSFSCPLTKDGHYIDLLAWMLGMLLLGLLPGLGFIRAIAGLMLGSGLWLLARCSRLKASVSRFKAEGSRLQTQED